MARQPRVRHRGSGAAVPQFGARRALPRRTCAPRPCPGVIRVDRFVTHLANGQVLAAPITSCDYAAPPGFKRVMAFTPAGGAASPNCSVFAAAIADETMRPAGMCAQYDLDHPLILKRVLELMAR